MCIFKKKPAKWTANHIMLVINNLKFFDMGKNTTNRPVLQRNGVKISLFTHNHIYS